MSEISRVTMSVVSLLPETATTQSTGWVSVQAEKGLDNANLSPSLTTFIDMMR